MAESGKHRLSWDKLNLEGNCSIVYPVDIDIDSSHTPTTVAAYIHTISY